MRYSAATVLAFVPAALAITPQLMLGAPRRSDASPNPSGEWAVVAQTNYDWEEHAASAVWMLMDVGSGEMTVLTEDQDVSEMFWVGPTDTSILYVNGTNPDVPGGVTMYMTDAMSFENAQLVGSLDAPFSGLKARMLENGDINFAMYAMAYRNGSAYNAEMVPEPLSTAQIYDDTFVRHWDTWLTPQRYAVFSGVLSAGSGGYPTGNSSYSFDGTVTNLLMGIEAPITRPETPVQPFGDATNYDISPDGQWLAFLSKAPELPKANYTASYIYLVPFDGSATAVAINSPDSNAPENARGASSLPLWSWDSQWLMYYQMDDRVYESDRNILYLADIGGASDPTRPEIRALAADWDRSPDLAAWSRDNSAVYVGAADLGNEKIYSVPVDAAADFEPQNITGHAKWGTVAAFYVLPDDTLLVSDSSIVSSRNIYTIPGAGGERSMLFAANEVDENLAGLTDDDYDEFYYQGNDTMVQAWIVYPADFDPSQSYPLAFLIHGGPQSAWSNAWSTRWNPKTWADQGYVVVAPNPTGSTSFGEVFQDRIQNNWGSYPYDDLVRCHDELQTDRFPFIDTDNGIAAGASYGGYMTNWIQGHDLGRRFRALVTHDGSTSTLNQYATEELWFMQRDFNGTLWDNRENYEVWDPIAFASEFATPHYVVHNTLDYRLPESEGVMLFNVLQERGVPSRFLSFPDENHWVLNRENSLVWHTEIYNWINHYTELDNEQAIDTEQYVGSG